MLPRSSKELNDNHSMFLLLQSFFGEEFEWQKTLMERYLPDRAKLLQSYVDSLPDYEISPVSPWGGIVTNLNVSTTFHRDWKDWDICAVMVISECKGGAIVYHEIGLVVEAGNGDFMIDFLHFIAARRINQSKRSQNSEAQSSDDEDTNDHSPVLNISESDGDVRMNNDTNAAHQTSQGSRYQAAHQPTPSAQRQATPSTQRQATPSAQRQATPSSPPCTQPRPKRIEYSENEDENEEEGLFRRNQSTDEDEDEDEDIEESDDDDNIEVIASTIGNGISVRKNPASTAKEAKKRASRARENETHVKQLQYTPEKNRTSTKIRERDFTPNTRVLAKVGKKYICERAAFGDAYPPQQPQAREDFMAKLLQEAANKGDKSDKKIKNKGVNGIQGLTLTKVLSKTRKNDQVYDRLSIFVLYGKRNLMSELVIKTRDLIGSHYGIPGDLGQSEIIEQTKWLLEGSRFRCGGIDLQNQTFDNLQPFLHPIIAEVIKKQWFVKGQADQPALSRMVEKQRVFPGVIILATTCIEHCLKDWKGGEGHKTDFSKANSGARYEHYTLLWETLAEGAPDFMRAIEGRTYERITHVLRNMKNMNLSSQISKKEVEASLHGVDLAELNATANKISHHVSSAQSASTASPVASNIHSASSAAFGADV
ncbi:hypothetical protein NLJ89_g7963 [Agrocybe chaxingu]|uniref:DUF6532 domain-containing protein n=1 Tax=Agrocybe chaxingu TaxID=84603 RepID=A0A9W8JVS9_9AGAR|nr:hypothetical protein NLJ89_g7963 [Agrocybe chaxingu]